MARLRFPFPSVVILLLSNLALAANATTIHVFNNCQHRVWAAASPGGGKQLNHGETWTLNPPDGTKMARIWPRTGCTFDANGHGHCDTGDCGGVLHCKGYGTDPQTLAEYTLAQPDDTIDISLVEGFNVPLAFTPTSNLGGKCRAVSCAAKIVAQCPSQLQTKGGCNNPCTVFKTVKYCCTPQRGSCGPTMFSKFFKKRCPDAYSYPQDDNTSTFACPHDTNYKVTFCP